METNKGTDTEAQKSRDGDRDRHIKAPAETLGTDTQTSGDCQGELQTRRQTDEETKRHGCK